MCLICVISQKYKSWGEDQWSRPVFSHSKSIKMPFATELIRMIAAKIGQRYLIINWKTAFRRNG